MANKNLFSSALARVLPRTDTVNQAGGNAYAYGPEALLAQLAATGTLSDGFYSDAQERLAKALEAAWAVDADVPPANYGDNPGTMWEPGETFIDPDNGLAIKVERETANGFVVTIGRPTIPQVFRDGFDEATASLRPGSKIISTDTH